MVMTETMGAPELGTLRATDALLTAHPIPARSSRQDTMPEFKRHWYFKRRKLDVRPMIWSLVNRPEEWRVSWRFDDGRARELEHTKTRHKIVYLAVPYPFGAAVSDLSCSCSGMRLQFFQGWQLKAAARAWVRENDDFTPDPTPKHDRQFRAHFDPKVVNQSRPTRVVTSRAGHNTWSL